jgi:hypothetical protein
MSGDKKPLIIIPAAGFGRRVGSPPAKELLLRASTKRPYIDAPIEWSRERNWEVLVITRRDKQILIEYLSRVYPHVSIHCIESSPDWQSTVLQARSHWLDNNLILLPDTEFSPLEALDQIAEQLFDFDVVAGVHRVSDPEHWGHMRVLSDNVFEVAEKPNGLLSENSIAWGLLGFRKSHGESLLSAQWMSQRERKVVAVQGQLGLTPLKDFKDLLRK